MRAARRLVRSLTVLAGMCLLPLGVALAQVDPRGPMRTIATEHFRVHFAPAHEALARRSAAFAELAYTQLAEELAEPDGPVELLVADNVDFSNGFATPFPTNRIVVYALPPLFTPELRHSDDWLQLVITHELAHVFHLDRARGLWSLGRKLFGRHPVLIPNALLPSWIIEGLAVHYETKFTGSGRLESTQFPMVARTAALDSALPPPDSWSLATSRFPLGQHAYGYGSMLLSPMAQQGDGQGMRRFVDEVAVHPLPARLNRAARKAFGESFSEAFARYRDSLARVAGAARAWAALDTMSWIAGRDSSWFAEQPRWESDSTLLLGVNNGTDVGGVYRATVHDSRLDGRLGGNGSGTTAGSITMARIARRNSLDGNAPTGDGGMVFAQIDLNDPYQVRSQLWRRSASGSESRLGTTDRLFLPDVRTSDGTVVAVRAVPGSSDLVLLRDGAIARALVRGTIDTAYTEPRWSPDGTRLVAVRLLRSGEEQIVVLDTMGTVQQIVSGVRGVQMVPTFTPDGARVLWASDELGNLQLAMRPLGPCSTPCPTRWLTRSATGVMSPAVSPDGRRVAALEYTLTGWRLVVLPMHDGYALSPSSQRDRLPFSVPYRSTTRVATLPPDSSPSTSYNAFRQLLPHWWTPVVGQGSDGAATFGASSNGRDILGRHAWAAQATFNPGRRELEASGAYRFANLPRVGSWQPAVNLFGGQSWDRFLIFDTARVNIGDLQRVSRVYDASLTFSRPRVRTNASLSLGAQLETRSYATTPGELLGGLNPIFARGRQLPSVSVSGSWGNVMRAGRAISLEDGVQLSAALRRGWRSGTAEQGTWRATGSLRGYKALPSGRFARPVLAARVSGGLTDQHALSELSVGGTSGTQEALIPGTVIGDPGRLFPVRGFAPGAQYGTQALSSSLELRLPVALVARGVGLLPFFFDRVSLVGFGDAGRAWCSGAVRASSGAASLCLPNGVRDGWLASVGSELTVDMSVQWDTPFRARLGWAQPVAQPAGLSTGGALFFSLGASF